MSQSCLLSIPVHPYIRKFLLAKYGREPFECNQRNVIGRQLRSMIVKNPDGKFPNPSEVTVQLQVTASLWQARDKIKRHANSNLFMVDVFKATIEGYVNGAYPFLKSRKLAVEKFFTLFDITEEDLSYETVERWFHKRGNVVSGKQLDKYDLDEAEQKRFQRIVKMQGQMNDLRDELLIREDRISQLTEQVAKLETVVDYLQHTYLKKNMPLAVEDV